MRRITNNAFIFCYIILITLLKCYETCISTYMGSADTVAVCFTWKYEFLYLPNIIMLKVSVWIHTPNIETASTYMSDACRSWDTEPTNCSLPDTYSYIQNTGPVELVVVTRSRKCPDIVKDFPLILPRDGRVKLTTTFSSVLCFSFLLPCFSFPLYTLICVGDQ